MVNYTNNHSTFFYFMIKNAVCIRSAAMNNLEAVRWYTTNFPGFIQNMSIQITIRIDILNNETCTSFQIYTLNKDIVTYTKNSFLINRYNIISYNYIYVRTSNPQQTTPYCILFLNRNEMFSIS